ncbi:MAG: hypothetical protein CMJ58_01520 [Planctomycetaceae bacterium]|nr:hypothetical protein [Planctomycetaceae bacterium]
MISKSGFRFDEHGKLTVIHLPEVNEFLDGDLSTSSSLFEAMEEAERNKQTVLWLDVPPDHCSPAVVDEYWDRTSKDTYCGSHTWRYRDAVPLSVSRARTAISRLLKYRSEQNALVLISFSGEVDFDLLGLVLCCDYRICTESTTFVNNSLHRPTPVGAATPWHLTHYLGQGRAIEMLLQDRVFTASEFRDCGLVNQVAKDDDLLPETMGLASKLASYPPAAIRALAHATKSLDTSLKAYLEAICPGS